MYGNDNSAQPCGCDPGADWTCEAHKPGAELVRLNADLRQLAGQWRRASQTAHDDRTTNTMEMCAEELQEVLNHVR